jgi:hypothetical protein
MFPDRYRNSEQAQPTPSQSPGPGWRAAHAESFGAADLMFLFDAPGGDSGAALSNARDRAGAWAGGTATLWSQGGRDAVGLSLVSQAQSPSLCDSVTAWKNAAFAHGTPNDEHVTVQCHGNAVQAGFAPDAATANRLAGTG